VVLSDQISFYLLYSKFKLFEKSQVCGSRLRNGHASGTLALTIDNPVYDY
jgi:hypothetical protein